MRLTIVDGFRGIFLVFMMVVHANQILKTTFGQLNHHSFGWVEDAQGFVFMSGLVVGLVYGGRYLRNGYEVMHKAIWARIRTIYTHQIFLILLFLAVTLLILQLGKTPPNVLNPYAKEPVVFTLFSSALLTGSLHMGILPMYILFMMVTPFALRLLNAQRYIIYAALVMAAWSIAQTRVLDEIGTLVELLIFYEGHRVLLTLFFNAFGWGALYFGGLFVGFLMASKRLNLDFLKQDEMRSVFFLCVGLFFFYGIYDRIVFDDWFGTAFSEMIKAESDRGNFSAIYLVTFLIDLFIFVWLLGPGLSDRNSVVRGTAGLVRRVVTFPSLVFLGQHSLHVFSAHILIVYLLYAIFQDGPPHQFFGTLVILLCVYGLYIVAWLHAKSVERQKSAKTI
jgi:hypothetical protein